VCCASLCRRLTSPAAPRHHHSHLQGMSHAPSQVMEGVGRQWVPLLLEYVGAR
jgi:hypothetical protein